MKVLVTGGTGLLGTKVVAALLALDAAAEPDWRPVHVVAASRRPPVAAPDGPTFLALDITDRSSLDAALDEHRPDLVIHTAAEADVDACEREPARAEAINTRATADLAAGCRRLGARMVYVSTDYVFDGTSGPYDEAAAPNPVNVYARTKLQGEQAVRAALDDAVIARTAVLFGYSPGVRQNLALWLLDRLARGEPAPAATDQVGNPTLVDNLAAMLVALAFSARRGIYHTAGASSVSRYRFCQEAAEVFGYDPALVTPIVSAGIPRPARRPLDVSLNVEKFARDFPAIPPLTARQALEALRQQIPRRAVPAR
jgi:dTDP-4-dehydrorhamnose reductase